MAIPIIIFIAFLLIQFFDQLRFRRFRPDSKVLSAEMNVFTTTPSVIGPHRSNVFLTEAGVAIQDVRAYIQAYRNSKPARRIYAWRDVDSVSLEVLKFSKLPIDMYNVKIAARTKAGPINIWIRARNPHEFVRIANEQIASITNEKAHDAHTSGA